MAHTVTLIEDHKGFTRPRVSGDEYFVDAHINITAYVAGGVTVTASSLGLATINSAMVTGQEALDYVAVVRVENTGAYNSASQFKLALTQGVAEQGGTGDEGMVRVRVYGNI